MSQKSTNISTSQPFSVKQSTAYTIQLLHYKNIPDINHSEPQFQPKSTFSISTTDVTCISGFIYTRLSANGENMVDLCLSLFF